MVSEARRLLTALEALGLLAVLGSLAVVRVVEVVEVGVVVKALEFTMLLTTLVICF